MILLEVMHSGKGGQRMADHSRHGNLERDVEQVDSLNMPLLILIRFFLAVLCFSFFALFSC